MFFKNTLSKIFLFLFLILNLSSQTYGNIIHSVEHKVEGAGKKVGKTLKKDVKIIKAIKPCITNGLKIAVMLENALTKKTFPPNFCAPIKAFTQKCLRIEKVIQKLGPKFNKIMAVDHYLTGPVCDCASKVGSFANRIVGADFSKNMCADFKEVHDCCNKLLHFTPAKQICGALNKTVGKAADKVCKTVAGSCPALVASEAISVGKVVAAVAAMVVTTEAGPEVYIPEINAIINTADQLCQNVRDANRKKCCKWLGPLNKPCKPLLKFSSGVCTQLDCPIKMLEFIKGPSCSGYQELIDADCCGRIQKIPMGIGKKAAPLCKIFQNIAKKSLGNMCKLAQ